MELSSPTNTNTNTSCPTTIKNEAENETPTQIQQPKTLSFSNGLLKRHHHNHNHPLPHHHAVVVTYKECLKNHAAAMGSHAVDGCGEFMPSNNTNPNDPTSLKCAACGCHRNFHRREPDDLFTPPPLPALEYHPHHRHHPPPPPLNHPNSGDHSCPSSPSPPPISSSYNLLTLTGGGFPGDPPVNNNNFPTPPGFTTSGSNPNSKKRFRTKFSQEQKEKMLEFAEKVGWKFQKKDEEMMMGICNEIGIDKGVLKVWMHNNKNTLGKKDFNGNVDINGNGNGCSGVEYHHHHNSQEDGGDSGNNDGRSLDQLHQLLSSSTANGGSSS